MSNRMADILRLMAEEIAGNGSDPERHGLQDLNPFALQRGRQTLDGIAERLASANARGRFDNSALTIRGIRGLVFVALEVAGERSWAKQGAIMLPSDTRTETHTWMGQVPQFREHFGGILGKKVNDYSLTIVNRDFEAAIFISKHDWRRDKVNQVTRKVGEIAVRSETHWNERTLQDILETSPTAFDSVAFFSASHSLGASGTLSNLFTSATLPALAVADSQAPTREEAAKILFSAAAEFFVMKDDVGQPANQGAQRFMLVCPPRMAPGFIQAVSDNLFQQGGSNNLQNLGWSFEIVPEGRTASGNESICYLLRMDGLSTKPFLLQDDVTMPLEVEAQLEGSDRWIEQNEAMIVAKTVRGFGPLEFRHALKLTLS